MESKCVLVLKKRVIFLLRFLKANNEINDIFIFWHGLSNETDVIELWTAAETLSSAQHLCLRHGIAQRPVEMAPHNVNRHPETWTNVY